MSGGYNLCIIKPNKSAFSETFIQEHINRLAGSKKVLYGGSFPVYDDKGKYLIKSKIGLLSYLIQKRILRKRYIKVRNNALVEYFKSNKIDVVLAEYGMTGAMTYECCKRASIPLVIHFHGADAHHQPTIDIFKVLYKESFAYASFIIAVSNDMVFALKSMGAPEHKIILNPYGVDTEKFMQLDITRSARNFIFIGRFVAKKSPELVIKSFKIVYDKFPDARLWMVGSGTLFEETVAFTKVIGLSGKVIFPGILTSTEIRILMQKMRCFVQHSVTTDDGDMEGTPNAILEAGSSGLAIVSTLHAGIKEAVKNGETGFLVPEYDVSAMANCMEKIAEDVNLAAELGRREAIHIRENYGIIQRIQVLDSIIQNTLKKP